MKMDLHKLTNYFGEETDPMRPLEAKHFGHLTHDKILLMAAALQGILAHEGMTQSPETVLMYVEKIVEKMIERFSKED